MKILVLMPLDERYSYIATEIFKALPPETQDKTFCMQMFTEWQMATKNMIFNDLPVHWNTATFGSIIKAREVYKQTDGDFILIGNIAPDFQFDAIFNFQDNNIDLPYEDKYINKLQEVFKDEPVIMDALRFYDAAASMFTLHNATAAARFLTQYLESAFTPEEFVYNED